MTDDATTTCHQYVTLQPGDTPFDVGCPPSISSANIVHPSSGPSFTWVDIALWAGAALIVVLVLATTIAILVTRTRSAKHARRADSPDPASSP